MDIDTIKDEDLVLLIRQKGDSYFLHLQSRYHRYAFKILMELGITMCCAKLLSDEGNYVYIDALNRAVNDYVFGISPFRQYFGKILVRTALNFIRRENGKILSKSTSLDNSVGEADEITFSDVSLYSDPNADPKEVVDAGELIERIVKNIKDKRNSECVREIISLRLRGYTSGEIAVITGYNPKTVRNIVASLKNKLFK